MFKFRLRGDDEFLPAVRKLQMTAQSSIEPLGILLFAHALAVGGIADQDTGIGGQAHLGGIAVLEGDDVAHACLPGIGHGEADALGVIVRAHNPVIAVEFLVLGFLPNLAPDFRVTPGKGFAAEAAVHTGGLVLCNEGSLNGNSTGAAEGVPYEVPAPVAGQLHHGGSQRLPQGGIIANGPVATLVQAGAGGIQKQLHPVIHDRELQLVLGTGFRQPGNAVLFAQPPGGRLLDDGLTVRYGHELGIQAVALHREIAVLGDKVLQIGLVDPLKQLFKGGGLEICQRQQHPLAGAQADIGPGHGGLVAGKQDAAIFHPDIFNVQPPQFVACQSFQAKQAGNGKFKIRHSTSILLRQCRRTFPLGGRCPEGADEGKNPSAYCIIYVFCFLLSATVLSIA